MTQRSEPSAPPAASGTAPPAAMPIAAAWLACLALLVAGCGGGGGGSMKPPPDKPPEKKSESDTPPAGPVVMGDWIVLGENPKWKAIGPLYEAYVKRDIDAVWNPMVGNLTDFVTRPVVETVAAPGAEAAPGAVVAETNNCNCKPNDPACRDIPPLQRAPLATYRLVMLMTGLPVPKALVVDQGGEQQAVQRGDTLGCEGGRVDQITQYQIYVSVPGKEKKVEISIAPPLTRVDEKAEEQNSEL